jgi:hypothetical protein
VDHSLVMSLRSWLRYGVSAYEEYILSYNIGEYVKLMHGRYLKRSMILMTPTQRVKRWKKIEL